MRRQVEGWAVHVGRTHITIPRCFGTVKPTVAAEGTLPGRAHFPHRGFIEYSWAGADPRAKGQALLLHSGSDIADSGRLRNFPVGCQLLELGGKRLTTYARSKGYEAKTISQPLSWRQDMIQRLSR